MSESIHPGLTRVLVIDDHAISRQFTVAALRQSPCTVKQAATPVTALELALSWLPHLICMDVELPGSNGYELARQIGHGWPNEVPRPRVLMLSADPCSAAPPGYRNGLEHAFLPKPVSAQDLRGFLQQGAPSTVCESSLPGKDELLALLRRELVEQMDEIDRRLAAVDLEGTRSILHRLLASSRLCGQRRLESRLLTLHAACVPPPDPGSLACGWYRLRVSASSLLAGRPD